MFNNTSLIQSSVETAAEDIATEGPERWSYWLLYLLISLREKGVSKDGYRGVLKRLRSDIESRLSE